jgi:hypothetical protein
MAPPFGFLPDIQGGLHGERRVGVRYCLQRESKGEILIQRICNGKPGLFFTQENCFIGVIYGLVTTNIS